MGSCELEPEPELKKWLLLHLYPKPMAPATPAPATPAPATPAPALAPTLALALAPPSLPVAQTHGSGSGWANFF